MVLFVIFMFLFLVGLTCSDAKGRNGLKFLFSAIILVPIGVIFSLAKRYK